MTPNLENIRSWRDDLLDPENVQGHDYLETDEGEFCCLGRVCVLAECVRTAGGKYGIGPMYDGEDATLPRRAIAWLGLSAFSDDPRLTVPPHLLAVCLEREAAVGEETATHVFSSVQEALKRTGKTACSHLNDTFGLTFPQIAECIEATWPEAFTQEEHHDA